MSTGVKTKKPCGIYWDIGDASVVGSSIKETLYLVRSVCQSNDLDDVSFQCISSVNSISDYVDVSDTIQLITVSDYSKANACAKIIQLIEQFLYEFEPGCPIILIDPNNLFSTPLNNLSTRFDFEIYFIHLERTFDPSLEPIADNHFYLEGSSIYPTRPLTIVEIGTLAIKNYPSTIDTFNLILEIDHLYKSYGRIENSTICTSELAVVWVFFPSQQLAKNAASETQEITFRGSPLSIVYLNELPCPISDHPILASLICSSSNPSPEKISSNVGNGDIASKSDPDSSDDPSPAIEITPSTPTHQVVNIDSESSQSSNLAIVHELLEPDPCSLDAAETLSQLSSANTSHNNTNENIQIVNDASGPLVIPNEPTSGDQITLVPITSLVCSIPRNLPSSSINKSTPEPSRSSPSPPPPKQPSPKVSPTPILGLSNLNSSKNSDGKSDKNSPSGISPRSDCPFGVIAIQGRPKEVEEGKFYRDMHGLFKKFGRLEDTTIIQDDAVLLGFPDDQTAKRVAAEKNGMIYFGTSLCVTHIKKPTSNLIAFMKNEPVPCTSRLKQTVLQDPNLIVTMKSLKRSAPKSSIHVGNVSDIGTIAITNTPEKMEVRNLLAHLNGHFKRQGAIRDSAIWFKGAVWICFPDKKLAKSAATKSHGMNFQGVKLTVNYIENPPDFLLETHFVYLLTPSSSAEKSKSSKRAKRSNSQQSSAKGSATSGSVQLLPNSGSKSSIGSIQLSKSFDSTKEGQSSKRSRSKRKSKSGSILSTDKPPTPSGQRQSPGSKPNGQSNQSSPNRSIPMANIIINSSTPHNSNHSQNQMDTRTGQSDGNSRQNHERVETDVVADQDKESEESIAYYRHNREVYERCSDSNDSLGSDDSLENYMLSESIIYPIDGLVADSRFDYYQSSTYHNHKFSNLIKDSLRSDRFVIFEDINFKAYPSKFWVFFHILRMIWPHGVLKIVHVKNEVYILFANDKGAKRTVQMFNKCRRTEELPNTEWFTRLETIKASIPEEVPSSVFTLIAMYSGTYSPWCFSENWNLFYLAIQVKNFVEAGEFAVSKGIVSNFGSLFIKPKDSQMIVAFADEKRVIHTMLFMRHSAFKFDFHPSPTRPTDLLTLIRDYDLTGYCARLSQIALQQTFKLIEYKLPPPFILVQDSCIKTVQNSGRDGDKVEINFSMTSARTCETSPPIHKSDEISQNGTAATLAAGIPHLSEFYIENRINYFLRIDYNARHIWCYIYDILSKLWCYRIVKITYRQDHASEPAETWLEVPSHVHKDDIIKRLSAINYLKTPATQCILRPPFDILNNSISTGSSPWFFNSALNLKYLKVIPSDDGQPNGSRDTDLEIRSIKHIVEDEHAIFVKLFSNAIWIAFPDKHSMLQGYLLLNHEQRILTGLTAYSIQEIPNDLLSSIDIEDLVGVARDLALANSLEGGDL